MSEEAAKVTVFCTREALAARIRGTDPKGLLCVVAPDPDKAIYEYAPALYVHVPRVVDYETRRRREPPNVGAASEEYQNPEVALHKDLEAHGPATPDFAGVPGNLHAAIREGHILAVAFAEKFVIDADARGKQREVNGFVEQLSRLEYWMGRQERELIEYRNSGGGFLPNAPLEAILAKLGNSYVHKAYERAERWVRCHNLNSPPPEFLYKQDFDVKRACAEFEKLRAWFEGTTGWIQGACVLWGLLPFIWPGVWDAGFVFVRQDPPVRKPQAASPAVGWVTGMLPFFVPEITVRVEPRPARPAANKPPAPIAPGPLAARDAALARARARILDGGPSAEKETAEFYCDIFDKVTGTVSPDEVRIEPLIVNAIGQTLGIAVRIRKGAVLVLPECRDEEAKARLVSLLATELWEPIQEWREPRPKAAVVVAPAPAKASPAEAAPGAAQLPQGSENVSKTDWQEIRDLLLKLFQRGDEYTSQRELATRLNCAPGTVKKALKSNKVLESWSQPAKHPQAQALNEVVTDKTESRREGDPADALLQDEIDAIMARLINDNKTKPGIRSKLDTMNSQQRRILASWYNSLPEDADPAEMLDTYLSHRQDKRAEHTGAKGPKIRHRKV